VASYTRLHALLPHLRGQTLGLAGQLRLSSLFPRGTLRLLARHGLLKHPQGLKAPACKGGVAHSLLLRPFPPWPVILTPGPPQDNRRIGPRL
jgi:hypothetical protein